MKRGKTSKTQGLQDYDRGEKDMGQRVEVSAEIGELLTQRANILEWVQRDGERKVVLELPDTIANVSERGIQRLFRRFRWLWGRRWSPEDD